MTTGPASIRILAQQRLPASDVDLPCGAGGSRRILWFQGDSPVYAGRASGKVGLGERLRNHLATEIDLSRSPLRRNVADHLLGIPTEVRRLRPPRLSPEDVAAINGWLTDSPPAGWSCHRKSL